MNKLILDKPNFPFSWVGKKKSSPENIRLSHQETGI